MSEPERIAALLERLLKRPKIEFPQLGEPLDELEAPKDPGVYIILTPRDRVAYVGRTKAQKGLRERLYGHLNGRSVFARNLSGGAATLRNGYSFQCLVVKNDKARALLEHLATGVCCPKHLGV